MKSIEDKTLDSIERALGRALYDWQRDYLQGKRHKFPTDRGSGKTYVHCIKLALSEGSPIPLSKLYQYSDYGDGSLRYARQWVGTFLPVWKKLRRGGLDVRKIDANK